MSIALSGTARRLLEWLRTRDAGLAALRRAGRAAIVMPGVFALCHGPLGNPVMAVFAAFSAMSGLLFVDFTGPWAQRLAAQVSLVLAGAVLVVIGTLLSRSVALATIGAAVVGFLALFSGVVSSVLASASLALIVSFILPVTLSGPVSEIPDRVEGWLVSGIVGLVAIRVLWPAPTREPLRIPLAHAARLLAGRLRAEVDCVGAGFTAEARAAARALADQASAAVAALQRSFFATPYRPTGLSTGARMLVRLVDELTWLEAIVQRMPIGAGPHAADPAICAVKRSSAVVLDHVAGLVQEAAGDPAALEPELEQLREARDVMEQTVTAGLPVHHVSTRGAGAEEEFVSSLEPSFRAQEMSFATGAIAVNAQLALAARERTWIERLLGRQPEGAGSSLSSARERASAAMRPGSVWLHNSIRGAIALAAATAVAEETGVQHSFWVVLGTIAVLRSNALATGQNALRGLLGTAVGFVIGGAIVALAGTNTAAYWTLLPFAVFFAGMAPATISFAAGQAAFTTTLVVLYNIVAPAGWTVGLLRVEDIAIGCAISFAVGVLFWPRGAAASLGQALSEALTDSARYLRAAIEYGVSRCDRGIPARTEPSDEQRLAAAAARRLDDAFRGYLAERGAKHVPLAEVTALVSAVAGLRLAADALVDLWERDDAPAGDRTAARAELLAVGHQLTGWYEQAAHALGGIGTIPVPLHHDSAADTRLIEAVRRDLSGVDGEGTATAVKMIWTADHLDAARRLQATIAAPAAVVAARPTTWSLAASRG